MRESSVAESRQSEVGWGLTAAGISFTALVAGVVALAVNNLGNRYFWTDESSSLYTSLGWPGVGERAGSLAGAWNWTIETHVEPGLYNMLERFWALGAGTHITTLRLYPFLFFLIYLGALIGLGRLIRVPWFLIAGVVGLMLLENITPYYTVELRPSSAGLAASVVIPMLGLLLLKRPHWRMLLVFLGAFMFIGSMQYNSFPLEAAMGAVLLFFALARYQGTERVVLAGAGLFALLWLPVVYVVTRGNPLAINEEESLEAISGLLIPNMGFAEVANLLQQNLLSPTALPRTIFLLILPVMWITRRWPGLWSASNPRVLYVNFLWAFVLVATVATAAIGFLGVMPWIVGTRWSIAEVGLIGVSLLGLAGIVVERGLLRWKPVAAVAMAATVLISGLAGYRLLTYERFPGFNWNPVLAVMLDGEPGRSVVDTELYPDLRYWIELSGDYNQFQPDWVAHQVQTTSQFFAADASSVQEFLDSNNDRLLIGDASLIEQSGMQIPADVEIVKVPTWGDYGGDAPAQPVLLVRDR